MARAACSVPGCPRPARAGAALCLQHARAHAPRPIRPVILDQVAAEARQRQGAAAEEFARRHETGDYRGLFGEKVAAMIQQAAQEKGVTEEIGVLRIVMARLLAELRAGDGPVAQLAAAIAKIAAVSIQAAKTQRAISGELAGSLTDALTQILVELDQEQIHV